MDSYGRLGLSAVSSPLFAPTSAPSGGGFSGTDDSGGSNSSAGAGDADDSRQSTMDILAAVFFVVAAGWLFIAILYSCLAVAFLRLRARGQLDSIYEEDFGRLYLFPRWTRCRIYLPLGCLLRRYIAHVQRDRQRNNGSTEEGDEEDGNARNIPVRFMKREERRAAMEVLLVKTAPAVHNDASQTTTSSTPKAVRTALRGETTEDGVVEEEDIEKGDCDASEDHDDPVCSICLGNYERHDDRTLASATCSHLFHRDCILDWLERHNNSECPCCRVPMVDEDDVWSAVKRMRKQRRRQRRHRRRTDQKKKRLHDSGAADTVETTTSAGTGSEEAEHSETYDETESSAMSGDDDVEAPPPSIDFTTTESVVEEEGVSVSSAVDENPGA